MADDAIRLPDPSKLLVSSSPHIHDAKDVRGIMLAVVVALVPGCAAGVWFFGPRALLVLAVCAATCVGFEAVLCRLLGRPATIGDLSALVTGLLLGMNLSAGTPWWVCVIGSVIAIGLGKQVYGGLGYNLFNPALVGRVALLLAFPKILTTWVPPVTGWWAGRVPEALAADGLTSATPLGLWKNSGTLLTQGGDYVQLLVGNRPGCLGETSAIALVLGGLYLIWKGHIRWQVPVAFIGTVALFTGIVYAGHRGTAPTPLFHVLSGGLLLGAIFMATDMVTTPMGKLGGVLFGVGCGLVTCVIRCYGGYPEGVSFSILLMNALTPLIDRLTARRPFGDVRRKESAA
ncbi:MAG: Electron transport complex protein RnfD [Lentisphaerae bacterium ADurb.BinA184]|nr:MAG: Electron transport complex protein RnfD [Lentisphaerae bacterium ADurb.BinA184]